MSKETKMPPRIKLLNVRLSFPSLFKFESFNNEEGTKYAATFLIPKTDIKLKKQLDLAIQRVMTEAKIKVASDKICLKDGDESEYDGYEDNWSLKASNSKRPTVLNKDMTPLTEADQILYAGCYVNASIDFWVQNNKFGKRVNANLYGVQFLKDGEPFGMGPIDVTDDFDVIEEDEDTL